jgi:hypothetical protein
MKRKDKMKEIQFKSLITCVHVFLNTFYPVCPVIPSKNKTIDNLSSLITCIHVFLSSCPSLCRFGTCLIPVSYRFVSISIGIFPYVFVPQTSFPNQKRRKAPFPVFLNFVFSHLPGVHVDKKRTNFFSAMHLPAVPVVQFRDYRTLWGESKDCRGFSGENEERDYTGLFSGRFRNDSP